jgi:hypothetical protein
MKTYMSLNLPWFLQYVLNALNDPLVLDKNLVLLVRHAQDAPNQLLLVRRFPTITL